MSQVTGLNQYRSNALNGPYASPARAGKTAPLDLRKPSTGRELSKVSSAGDTVKVSETASTRAEVQAANTTSQKAQAGVTTARAVEGSLNKTADLLGKMQSLVQEIGEKPQFNYQQRAELGRQFAELAGQMDQVADTETFAGHKVLDGRFKVSFSVSEDSRVTIDATLPTGTSYSTEGLGLAEQSKLLREGAAEENITVGAAKLAAADKELPQLARSIDVAVTAVGQVRDGVGQAADSMIEALNSPSAPFGAPVSGATELARRLVSFTQAHVLADGAQAMRAQANISQSAALRLMG